MAEAYLSVHIYYIGGSNPQVQAGGCMPVGSEVVQ